MRIGACGALLLLGLAALSPASGGIPAPGNCEMWAEPDTADVQDTVTVYIILRDLYAEVIPGVTCDFFSDRGPTDTILDSPAITDQNGQASARVTTAYEPYFSQSNITVEVEDVVVGPATVSWLCRAGVGDPGERLPLTELHNSCPNPFGDLTEIGYSLEAGADVRLEVFDVSGRKIRTLAAGWASAGRHAARWDGEDDGGSPVPSGIYYVRMSGSAGPLSRPITLLR